ncbi:MAG TPA: acyl-CoA dehydrogenase family protein [Acidimicrobiia bacterium]|nr:acyl-CoA dehydrogenase family protein [Acidimicrobiia bacterium]
MDAFRTEARTFLEAHAEPDERGTATLEVFTARSPQEQEAWARDNRAWQKTLYDAGFAGLTLPVDVGGRGLGLGHALAWAEEESAFAVPRGLFGVSLEMVAPTLAVFGSASQRDAVRRILSGDELWCQLFSEPEAGSDLAAVRTRAIADGDGWRVSGQKVWTSEAHHARFGYLLARTDPDAPRHAGLTAFVIDLHQPGVTIRPLRQMTGGSSFNEVFFDDAVVEAGGVLGDVGGGWKVAMTTLGFERFTTFGRGLHRLVQRAAGLGWPDAVGRQGIARVVTQHRVLGWLEDRLQAGVTGGSAPGAEGTLTKMAFVRLVGTLADVATTRLGVAALTESDDWQRTLLATPGLRIAGGTDEILRNLVAERVLGLPR